MISQTAEYALRAAVFLAGRGDESCTTRSVSDHTSVPPTYLAKVLRSLHRAGLVESRRGPKGGYVLARSPRQISAMEVIDAVDPLKRLDHCPLRLYVKSGTVCPLHDSLARARLQIEEAFRTTSLSDLIDETGSVRRVPTSLSTPVYGPCVASDKEKRR